jgi:DNA-binding NarL/FixJ family response regulator
MQEERRENTENVGTVEKTYTNTQVKTILKGRSKSELIKTVQGLAEVIDTHKERERKIKEFMAQGKKNGFIAESAVCEILEILDGVK